MTSLEGWDSAIELHPRRDRSVSAAASGRGDSNPRPPAPKAGALPSCATPRSCRMVGTRARDRPFDSRCRRSTGPRVDCRAPWHSPRRSSRSKATRSGSTSQVAEPPSSRRRSTPRSASSPARCGSPGSGPGKAPRQLLEAPPRQPRSPASRRCGRAARLLRRGRRRPRTSTSIAPPEIDITAGEEDGDVEFDAVVEVRPVVELDGYDGLQRRGPEPAPSPTRPSTRRSTRCASASPISRTRRARSLDGDYAQIDIKGYASHGEVDRRARPRPTSSTRSAPAARARARRGSCAARSAGRHPRVHRRRCPSASASEPATRSSFRVLVKEAKRKVLPEPTDEWVVGGQRVRHASTSCAPTCAARLELYAQGAGADGCVRDKVLEAAAELVDIERARAARRSRRWSAASTTSRHRLEAQGVDIPQYLAATGQDQETFVADAARGRRAGGAGRPRAAGRRRRRRRSRRPTRSSTPRSTGWPSGSARSREGAARSRTAGRCWRRYALTSPGQGARVPGRPRDGRRRGRRPGRPRPSPRRRSRHRPTTPTHRSRTRDNRSRPRGARGVSEPIHNYLVPTVIEQTNRGERGLRHLLAAAQGAHHLPRHADRRHGRQPDHGAAAAPRERGPRQGHLDLHQLARWRDHGPVRDLRHDAVHQARRLRRSASARPRRPRPCSSRRARRASASPSRTPAILIHQPHGGAAGQAVDIEIQAKEIIRMRELLDQILAHHTGQTVEKVAQGHRPRLHHERGRGQGVRHHRRGDHQPGARCRSAAAAGVS